MIKDIITVILLILVLGLVIGAFFLIMIPTVKDTTKILDIMTMDQDCVRNVTKASCEYSKTVVRNTGGLLGRNKEMIICFDDLGNEYLPNVALDDYYVCDSNNSQFKDK